MIFREDHWNEETILKRANYLADIVVNIFNYEVIDTDFVEDKDEEVYGLDSLIEVANTKPQRFIFCGEEVVVKNYSDMLTKFIELFYDLEPKLVTKLALDNFQPTQTNRIYISYDSSNLRRSREINRTGIYYEINLSAASILYFIKQLIILSEFDVSEFEFILQ